MVKYNKQLNARYFKNLTSKGFDRMRDSTGFNLWADEYDSSVAFTEESNEYPFASYREVLNTVYNAARQVSGNILDIGFGTGFLTKKLYDDGYKVYGLDFSPRMIELAREKMPTATLLEWDFSNGLPDKLKEITFSAIIATYSIHHIDDTQKAAFVRELMNSLAPNGSIIFGDVSFETRADMLAARERAGDEWDNEEFYLIADEFVLLLPEFKVSFEKKSYCSGVMTITR